MTVCVRDLVEDEHKKWNGSRSILYKENWSSYTEMLDHAKRSQAVREARTDFGLTSVSREQREPVSGGKKKHWHKKCQSRNKTNHCKMMSLVHCCISFWLRDKPLLQSELRLLLCKPTRTTKQERITVHSCKAGQWPELVQNSLIGGWKEQISTDWSHRYTSFEVVAAEEIQ